MLGKYRNSIMSIDEKLENVKACIPEYVQLIAISKTRPASDIMKAYKSGQRLFGENKALEMEDKQFQLPKDIQWHFVGHLQTNKVRYIAPFVSLIHSVDSLKLLMEIDKEARRNHRVIDCLLEFHIAAEESKFGLTMDKVESMFTVPVFHVLDHVRICGVMGMATFSKDEQLIRSEFRSLKGYFDTLKQRYYPNSDHFCEISMGMTNDYRIAIEEGSTMVRVGTAIFGKR